MMVYAAPHSILFAHFGYGADVIQYLINAGANINFSDKNRKYFSSCCGRDRRPFTALNIFLQRDEINYNLRNGKRKKTT